MTRVKTKNRNAIIVPAYNEATIIGTVLNDLLIVTRLLRADVFVVNDGSTDQTKEVIKKLKNRLTIISYKKNRGKGYALRVGTERAVHKKYDNIGWIDSDGQLLPKDLVTMFNVLKDSDADMIVNDRIINFKVLPTSKIGRGTVRILFNTLFKTKIRDHLSGLRVFRSSVYKKIAWSSNDYRVEVETLARAAINKVKILEVKSICKKKLYRGIGWQDGLKIYYWIFWCFLNKKKLIVKSEYRGYTGLLISNSQVRAYIRHKFYIKNILRFVEGKTIDFGCGVGEVLKYLPAGSIGLEPDKTSVRYCRDKKLNTEIYDLEKNKYSLTRFKNKKFKTLLMNHVLEHIDSPEDVFKKLLREAKKLNIARVIVIVPCKKGFFADETHVDYIRNKFFENDIKSTDYKIINKHYYPINNELFGSLFRHQELVVIYEKI